MLSIIFETSERGDTHNWVKKEILKNGLGLISFEGYTVKNNKATLLLDRGRFEESISSINPDELLSTLVTVPNFNLKNKVEFAQLLGCPYYFFCYSYKDENCCLFDITSTTAKLIVSFTSYKDFAIWTQQYRELVMKSPYEESGLPDIDIKLRKLGIPWPGNLDYVLLKTERSTALIEFQNTSMVTVKNHCNNRWFLPSGGRKGDVNRWRAIDIIRQQSGLPLFIIVWSTKETEVKLKLVEKILYPEDKDPQKGLRYSGNEVMKIDRLIEILNRY